MAENKTNTVEINAEDKKVKSSLMKKGRKTIQVLQKMKDKGEPIVQMCPADRDKYFAMAADMAGCDVLRLTAPGENAEMRAANAPGGSATSAAPPSTSTSTSCPRPAPSPVRKRP